MGILKTISTIVMIFVDNPEKLADIEAQVYPAIDLILQGGHQDCLEDAIDVIVTISFVRKAISEQLWKYFPILYNLFDSDYFDYFDGMNCCTLSSGEVGLCHRFVLFWRILLLRLRSACAHVHGFPFIIQR